MPTSLLAFGINHKTAPVAIRERIAFAPERMEAALHDLTRQAPVQEAAILSTCNRTELYCGMPDADSGALLNWLGRYHAIEPAEVKPYVYTHPDRAAVQHMLRVASGLDSMVLGEPQILGQMKDAYHHATRAGTVGKLLSRLFQHTFSVAKQVRTDTAIGSSPVSVAFAAITLAKQIFGELDKRTALLIGAGDTIELAARHLAQNRIDRLIIANRTVERAHLLAEEFQAYAIALEEIPKHLPEADIVVSSTASPLPILGKGIVERAIKVRKHRPILMVDIAVPRDIEPEVDQLEDIYLYSVDDLHEIIEENLKSRQDAALQANEIIDTEVTHFMGWLKSLDAVATIRAYRDNAERLRDEIIARAERQLRAGEDPEAVLREMGRLLTNKLIHAPCAQLTAASAEGRTTFIDAARELFELDNDRN